MNMHRIIVMLVLQYLLVASASAMAAGHAELVVPEAFNVLKVDNKKYKGAFFSGGFLSGGDKTIKLAPGPHSMVIEYDVFWDLGGGEHERVYSKPFLVTFTAAVAKRYAIKPPVTDFLKDAQAYAEKPVINIIDRSAGRAVTAQVRYHKEAQDLYRFDEPAKNVVAGKTGAVASFQQAAPVTSGNMPSMMLEYWWRQANPQQRKQFIESRR